MRDVERAMKVIVWFHTNSELIDEVIREEGKGRDEVCSEDSSEHQIDDGNDELEQAEPVRTLKLFFLFINAFSLLFLTI